jgi:hypothetical protein
MYPLILYSFYTHSILILYSNHHTPTSLASLATWTPTAARAARAMDPPAASNYAKIRCKLMQFSKLQMLDFKVCAAETVNFPGPFFAFWRAGVVYLIF